MAGDWIKMRTNLDTDPAVVRISSALNADRFSIVGRLHRFWSWANEHLADGHDIPVDAAFIDQLLDCSGFAAALREVGWLSGRDGSLEVPKFSRHNGESAKKRALDAERKRMAREMSDVCPPKKRTESGPEKRRVEKKRDKEDPPKSPKGEITPKEFLERWNKFAAKHPKLTTCRKLTKERDQKLRIRLADPEWFETFKIAIQSLPLGGDGWQPTLDWFVRNEQNVCRLAEGEFDWRHTNDPAARKLQSSRRKRAAQESETLAEQQRHQDKQNLPQLRNAIESILTPKNGGSDENDGSSLLFGSDEISSANGAEVHDPSFEKKQRSISATS